MDEYQHEDKGTTALVLGIISVVLSLTLSRIAGFILGIIAIAKGAKYRRVSSDAKAGWILGIIGVILSSLLVGFILLLLLFCFMIPMTSFFWW